MDLGQATGLQFKFYCPDASPVSDFMFYLHSGNGWYAAKFEHTNPSGWTVVRIEKTDTTVEGQVAGWKRIDEIRISAWRGSDVNTVFYLADIGPAEADAPTVLLRAESVLVARKSPDFASVASAATLIGNHLQTLGVRHTTVSDLDVTESTLRSAKLVILPFNPEMHDNAVKALTAFQKNGGKVISFYQLPSRSGR
jgi:hypothetical protein